MERRLPMARAKIISVKTLREKRFTQVNIQGLWQNLLGVPERNFRMMMYGPSTSGKSSQALLLVDYLCDELGMKGLYNSFEEGHNKTLQARVVEREIKAATLYFGEKLDFETFCKKMKANRYHIGVIDSVKFMGMTYEEYKQLVALFPRKAFIFIGHGDSEGQPDYAPAKDILKACDIKFFIKDGEAKISSRYNSTKVVHRFYMPAYLSKTKPGQPTLL